MHTDINGFSNYTIQTVIFFTAIHTSHYYHYYYYYYKRFMSLCPELHGWAGTRRNIHPLAYPDYQLSFISFFHLLQSIASSLLNLHAWQSFL